MSASRAFQKAIVALLRADAGVGALVGDRIYDGPPAAATFPYVSIGPSDFVAFDAELLTAREETIQLDVWDRSNGQKNTCRAIVDAIHSALHRVEMALDDPYAAALVTVGVVRVLDDPDGVTAHGILPVTGHIEDTT